MEYCEMLFWLETEHSDKGLYQIIAQSRPVQMTNCRLVMRSSKSYKWLSKYHVMDTTSASIACI